MTKCFKCGRTDLQIVKHHLKYTPEIIVDCCKSCHTKIHKKLREENLCSLSRLKIRQLSGRSAKKRYSDLNRERISFSETIAPNVILQEQLIYNYKVGSVEWAVLFRADHHKELFYIED